MADLRNARAALADACQRLLADHRSTPAGSVIRCFARSVASARRAGTPPDRLAQNAEARARNLLALRAVPGQRVAASA